ncbi:hypothetical protein KY284_002007 [Solanum tuberosum]|nr:hypothetical protein KY284_002007 [Solanum tuberosum]
MQKTKFILLFNNAHLLSYVGSCGRLDAVIDMKESNAIPSELSLREWHIAWQQIEVLKPRLDIRCIRWIKPIKYKLNTDGYSKGNPGKAGGGGILRNERGHLIMAYAEYFGECSNNMSEAKAILFGIEWCLDKGFTNILVESDSMLIINMINGKAKTPWQIKHIIEDIHSLKVQGTFSFQHCYREVNMIADYLANMGVYTMQRSFFTEFLSLPMRVKKLMKNEIEELPTFRIRAQTKTFSFDHG